MAEQAKLKEEEEDKELKDVKLIAELYYKTYMPPNMTYEDVEKLAKKAYEYAKSVIQALNILDEAVDPSLTYSENEKRLDKYIKGGLEEEEKEVREFPYKPPKGYEEFYRRWMEEYKKLKY